MLNDIDFVLAKCIELQNLIRLLKKQEESTIGSQFSYMHEASYYAGEIKDLLEDLAMQVQACA